MMLPPVKPDAVTFDPSVIGLHEPMRAKVRRLEAAVNEQQQVDCPVRHYFAPGTYAREIRIPAGTVIVGAIHKTENLAVLSAGRLQLVTDDGVVEIAAPHTLTVRPGQKNAALALEDAVWTNFFPNPDGETDPDVLVEILTESTAAQLLGGSENTQLIKNRLKG